MKKSLFLRAVTVTLLALPLAAGCSSDEGGESDASGAEFIQPVQTECDNDFQCADKISAAECEVAKCVSGTCEAVPAPAGTACQAGGAGECERGACDNAGTCAQVIDAEDGTPCRPNEWNECDGFQCQDGVCVDWQIQTCDDDNPCTDDSCQAGTGCVFTPNTKPCNDLNPCTANDVCTDGDCAGSGNQCQCDTDADCVQFDDGDLCNGVLECVAGICQLDEGSEVTCESSDECQTAACNPATGACESTPVDDGTVCDDGDECTDGDACVAGVCEPGETNVCAETDPEVQPEPEPDAGPTDVIEDTTPDAEPETTPDVEPEATPDAEVETTLDAGPELPEETTEDPTTWAMVWTQVIDGTCNGCHAGGSGGMTLPSGDIDGAMETAYANIVDVDATLACGDVTKRVVPGEPESSKFYLKVSGSDCGNPMPLGSGPLPEADYMLIFDWIADGALP